MIVDGKHLENITCCYCRHRHPASLLCEDAARLAREEREREPVLRREGTKHVSLPPKAGRVVAMTLFQNELYVAFEYGVFKRAGEEWEQILEVSNGYDK